MPSRLQHPACVTIDLPNTSSAFVPIASVITLPSAPQADLLSSTPGVSSRFRTTSGHTATEVDRPPMAASCQPRHWQLVERKISTDSVHSAGKPGPPKQLFRSREHAIHIGACNRYPGDTTANSPYLAAPHAQTTPRPALRFFRTDASRSPFTDMMNYDFNAASRRSVIHLGSSRRAAANGTNNAFSVADECEAAAIALLARSTLLSHPFPNMLGSCEHQKLPR